MLTAVLGIYREGKIELSEIPPDIKEARAVVTFLPTDGPIDLRARGIDEARAAQIRWEYKAIAEDWEDPAMDVYNDM